MNQRASKRQSNPRPNVIYKNSNRQYVKWQYFATILFIIFLGLNALPNLYPKQASIQISASLNQETLPSVDVLKSVLNTHGIAVSHIHHTDNIINIQLQVEGEENQAADILRDKLQQTDEIKIIGTSSQPEWLTQIGGKPIKLGLDLSGGVLFILEVDSEQAFKEHLAYVKNTIHSFLIKENIRGVKVVIPPLKNKKSMQTVLIESKNAEKLNKIQTEIGKLFLDMLMLRNNSDQLSLSFSQPEKAKFHQSIMQQALATMRERIEKLGITEAVILRQGYNRIRIELPGVKNTKEAKKMIGATASLNFYQLQEHSGKSFSMKTGEQLFVNPKVIFSGENIKNAQAGVDEMGVSLVNLSLDDAGTEKILKFSSKNIGQSMVTVFSEYYRDVNDKAVKQSYVVSVATIQSQLGSRFSITNLATHQQALELANYIRAGSLAAPVTIVKQQTIDATLGKSNVENGIAALILGVALTLVFMALWYRRLGLIANCTLILNLVCLVGVMSLLPGVVLTLPGIAGLVLTVGMAVDTNVIIFERIKEELQRNRNVSTAIESGYQNAFSTIFDANVTTILTAIILYSIGYGPVKGFAITLGLGILTSMFTGVFISRILTQLFYSTDTQRKNKKRSPKGEMI